MYQSVQTSIIGLTDLVGRLMKLVTVALAVALIAEAKRGSVCDM